MLQILPGWGFSFKNFSKIVVFVELLSVYVVVSQVRQAVLICSVVERSVITDVDDIIILSVFNKMNFVVLVVFLSK